MTELVRMSSADLDESDVEAVLAVMRSGRLALGPKIPEFEEAMASYAGVRNAVAVSSGTAALHVITRALHLGPGDEVLVPSFTFAASVNVLLYEGATPVFVDIDPETLNLDPAELERRLTPRTKAIMAVDVFGHPAEWDEITSFARAHRLKVIDDCCEAVGAEYRGRRLGGFGDAAAFAFYPNKQMTTGEGGMVVTNDDALAAACRSLRNQGRREMGAWLEHESLGFNYRLNELAAALGSSQLRRLDTFLEKRRAVANLYAKHLEPLAAVTIPRNLPHVRRSWFVYVVTLAEGLDRDAVIHDLAAKGIPARGYFSPVHMQKYIRNRPGIPVACLPVTEAIARRTIALPFHNNLTEAEVVRVVEALSSVLADRASVMSEADSVNVTE
jgi:perosamine synthetase